MGFMARSIHCTTVGAAGAAAVDVHTGVESCRLLGYSVTYNSACPGTTSVTISNREPRGLTKDIMSTLVGNTNLPMRSMIEPAKNAARVDSTVWFVNPILWGDVLVQVAACDPLVDAVVVDLIIEV